MSDSTIYPLSAVRALALHAQGLVEQPDLETPSTPDEIFSAVERVGCLQIDTLQMVRRSHYIALWSRLGMYDTAALDGLVYDPGERRLFEYWLHAASIIPLSEYRYRLHMMRRCREGGFRSRLAWLDNAENVAMVEAVLERVRDGGAMRTADFSHERDAPRKGWWDWKPSKHALEYLYDRGDLMVTSRVNFQRVYDLRERVLPDWVDTSEPTEDEAVRHLLELSMRCIGICHRRQLVDYVRMKRTEVGPHFEALLNDGTFVKVRGCLIDGSDSEFVMHRDSLPALEEAADGALVPRHTTFLTAFDSLFWAPGRDAQLWGFEQRLEAYTPEPKRRWGYFCLPILHRDRLVGRFDPKLERRSGTLRLKALHLEPSVLPDEELVASVAKSMRAFMVFHDATELTVERSEPAEFGVKLLAAL